MSLKPLTLIFFTLWINSVSGQIHSDTLRTNLDSAERLFLYGNYSLLAQKYNIDAQKALIIQARLWPNPNLSVERGPVIPLYDPNSQFPHSNFFLNSENAASLSQLILLAGKRNKQIKLAEANATLSEYQFFDLLRTLKYTLRTDFFNIYYLQESAKVYNAEIKALQQIVNAFAQQEGKGYISEKEVIRIKAQLYSFQSEFNDLINQINDVESELRLVLQVKPTIYIDPVEDSNTIKNLDPEKFALNTLIDSAYKNRTDLLIARKNFEINKLNYNYQKALAVPDLTASASYDKQGSYALYFNSVGVSMDLPFFNRNQGNIKSAKALIANTDALQKSTEATVAENVSRSLQKAFSENKLYQSIDPNFSNDFERLMHEVLINYQRRNIGLLEFLDFYDSYKQNVLQINSIKYNRVQAFEDINYYTGTEFFQP
ncbi:MAG TPA: TolC family protein [Puia sp.]|jgi:cobalt-zinc-cadmium efflux system outer membrane protein|nr:TolC family protein [Puia sp.]